MSPLQGASDHKFRRFDRWVSDQIVEPRRFRELTAFVVGDDRSFTDTACDLFRSKDIPTRTFETGEGLVAALNDEIGLLVTQLRLRGMNGLEVLKSVRQTTAYLPAIVLGSELPARFVVRAFRLGAINALELPCNRDELWHASAEGLRIAYVVRDEQQELRKIDDMLGQLDDDETTLLNLTLNGSTSKESGEQLGFAVRTIERQRSRIYEKLGVKSAIDAMRLQQRKLTLEARVRAAWPYHHT